MQCLWGLLSSCLNQVSSLAASARVCEVQRPSLLGHSHCLSAALCCQGPAERRRPAPARPLWGVTWRWWVAVAGARLAGAWIRCGSGPVHLHRRHRPPLGPRRPHLDTVKSPPLLSSFRHTLLCTRRSEQSPTLRREKPGPVTLRVASSRRLSSSTTSSSSSSSSPSYPRLPHARPRH